MGLIGRMGPMGNLSELHRRKGLRRLPKVMRILGLFFNVVRRDPLLIVCGLFLILVVGLALVGIHFTGYTYDEISDASLLPPSRAHWFGTDVNGHDLFTRTLFGAQISLFVAAMGTIVSLTVGVTYGMISGYAGGRVDNLMMRLGEIIYPPPTLVLVIVMVTTLEKSVVEILKSAVLTAGNQPLLLIVGFLGLT